VKGRIRRTGSMSAPRCLKTEHASENTAQPCDLPNCVDARTWICSAAIGALAYGYGRANVLGPPREEKKLGVRGSPVF
jgi:hypothetical protein